MYSSHTLNVSFILPHYRFEQLDIALLDRS